MAVPAFYAVDWGTTNFRAFAVAADGAVPRRHADDGGLLAIRDRTFEAQLLTALGPWLEAYGPLPVLMAGMVGAKSGWLEAPYLSCPVGGPEIAAAMVAVPNSAGLAISIVPGLAVRGQAAGDVLRGEETSVLGFLRRRPDYEGALLLPGTHSKCVLVGDGRVLSFRTAMTGEIYRALLDHTILGQTARDHQTARDRQSAPGGDFDAGLERGLAGEGFLQALFAVRTRALLDNLDPAANGAYLSGLLIGFELAALMNELKGQEEPVPLIGAPGLTALYARALQMCGRESVLTDPQGLLVEGLMALQALRRETGE